MPSATFAHLDLAHVVGAVAAKLMHDAQVGTFESFDHDELAIHLRQLDRGVHIIEVAMGALSVESATVDNLQNIIRDAESSAHLIGSWLARDGARG